MSSRSYHRALNLPPRVANYVTQNNPVRTIDTHADILDSHALGFKNTKSVIGDAQ